MPRSSRKSKPKTALAAARPMLRKATRVVNKEINTQRSGAGQRPVRCN